MDTKCFTPCSRIRVVEGGCRCYNDFTPERRSPIEMVRASISLIINGTLDKITIRYNSEGDIEIFPTGTDPNKGDLYCADSFDDRDIVEIANNINNRYKIWL